MQLHPPWCCACPAYEFILCNCSILAKFRTKLSGRIKLPDRQMRLWPRRGRLAWQILPRPSRSPIPNARCADQNCLRQAIFVIKRTKPNIPRRPPPWLAFSSFRGVSQERSRARAGASLIVISSSAHKSLADHRKTASCKSKNNSIYNRWSRGERSRGKGHLGVELSLRRGRAALDWTQVNTIISSFGCTLTPLAVTPTPPPHLSPAAH